VYLGGHGQTAFVCRIPQNASGRPDGGRGVGLEDQAGRMSYIILRAPGLWCAADGEPRPERRKNRRFPIDLDIRWVRYTRVKSIAETGMGSIIDISAGGVAFTSASHLVTTGMYLELEINWPVLLNGSCPMKLMISGWVVRSNEAAAAVTIRRYQFHTRRSDADRNAA
jgi:hypothetical protein